MNIITHTCAEGKQDVECAIQDQGGEENQNEDEAEHPDDAPDFEIDDEDESAIPTDLDGWHWAFSDSEEEQEDVKHHTDADETHHDKHPDDNVEGTKGTHRVRIAEQREEYIQCEKEGLLFKPDGSTLGVHPGNRVWRASYPGSKHFGRSWGGGRSPKKALLEVIKLVLEEHMSKHPTDKIAKGQLARVSKAWNEA